MNNLIRNELSKIFHKKAIYIVLIIILIFNILNSVIEKFFINNDNIASSEIDYAKQQLNEIDVNDPSQKDLYYSLTATVKSYELAEKYSNDSWQKCVINSKGHTFIENMLRAEGTAEYDKYKQEYENFISLLNSNDWKKFATQELELVNSQLSAYSSSENEISEDESFLTLKDQQKILNWRLEENIPYGNNTLNSILDNWTNDSAQLRQIEKQAKIYKLSHEEEIKKQELAGNIKLYEYSIKNNFNNKMELNSINNQTAISSNADMSIVQSSVNYFEFVLIGCIIIAGTIVSDESNKGTIKLLLVRPYKRYKILLAKFISTFIMIIFFLLSTAIIQSIVSGFTYGFDNYVGRIIVYNYKLGEVKTISTIGYFILTAISVMPQYLLLVTLAFSISTILSNTATAIALPLLGSMVSGIINLLFSRFKNANFLKFFVTPNWDLTNYLFGKIPHYEGLSLTFSIAICLIYFIIMITASFEMFKRKDIKNI